MKTKQGYNKLLSTPEWKAKRDEVLKERNYTCERCGSQTKLQVHHTFYDMEVMPWEYKNESLLVLCNKCHYEEHFEEKQHVSSEHISFPTCVSVADRSELSTISKFAYLIILEYKAKFKKDSPSYKFMYSKYGISNPTYRKCLVELEKFGVISYKTYFQSDGKKRIKISIVREKIKSQGVVHIPRCIISCDTYNSNQKIFIAMVWKLIVSDKRYPDLFFPHSDNAISKSLFKDGWCRASVLKMLKELSDPSYGFVPILTKHKFGYSINKAALSAIEQRNNERWEEADKYPIYTKPSAFDFTYVEEDGVGKIIKNK